MNSRRCAVHVLRGGNFNFWAPKDGWGMLKRVLKFQTSELKPSVLSPNSKVGIGNNFFDQLTFKSNRRQLGGNC